ncbi:hypothetical protein CDO52_02635 [Nocardiopsis gilva YIM 90087]|uniref:Uncharacterized protein n=1 Tax=Nocardiopsis gilva YIM 90087 TaxID=1235441 RepID=A0A223S159_9ACTN|nr:hypothetical protein [Nocardiopsis gilva]ASU81827.1 hypothetical protein CDO52_02635 [Nocardiopsis gilva YIM 90087]
MSRSKAVRWSTRAVATLATAVGALAFAGVTPALAASECGCPMSKACEQLGECPPGMCESMHTPAMKEAMQHMQLPLEMAGMMEQRECDMAC